MKTLPCVIIMLLIPAALCAAGFFDPDYVGALYRDASEQLLSLEGERNTVYTPAGAALCGALLCVGASEEEAAACAAAFGLGSDALIENSVKALSYLDKPSLKKQQVFFSGALWYRKGARLSPDYAKALESFFGPRALAYEAGEELSRFFEELSLRGGEEADAVSLLACGAAAKPRWTTPAGASRVDYFLPYIGERRALVYFAAAVRARYYETERSFFVSMPFAGDAMRLDIYCSESRLQLLEAVRSLGKGGLPSDNTSERDLLVYMPGTVIESREEPLERLGAKGLRTLGYSHILGKRPMPVDDLIAKGALTLEPGEDGEAPAAAAELSLCRPFVFVVRDEKYGLPLMAGVCASCK
ncbi:MAG: hypothetical protein IK083_09030 [Abditibacteriota bacterium]|nr:hypothetical protein [Abditibacteriota bacterium]